ncbi:hypothetical protein PPSIR1_24079 [Plesiocystis pacifica SIR-1]|uniref:Uncharacterized protein n=1 Tax=Plesiocystis pacifica SIR-1 TaxID=391625 RepID=A6GJS1_9BACT|nr:hypothetical protein PPSIR1_24079 [Plesiocystis pacifica SIR-1]
MKTKTKTKAGSFRVLGTGGSF